ncbi:hypothetical protein [Bacillus swezeyi]|uniref:Uncharacterized protein n=1 Tax=Bacillus swezeyi TaxID=1925020 RepID=A0A5M8RQQ6_9BACI|nr:hypothetical protein [Bacillus swezeyi]KAA6450865.1 hypothetical protein DX927_08485 [Bacillus swezeyi]TYS37400.1 hypothetical protein FZC77_08310 [Bacillus swezeyi]
MFKKFLVVLCTLAIAFGFSSPVISHASQIDGENPPEVSADKKQIEMAEKLSNYFELDKDGNIHFTADKETLMEMGISEHDSKLMTSMKPEEFSFEENKDEIQAYGFVGLHLKLGPKVRAMSAVAAGAFAAGYVGWYVKQIAAAGPWGAGAAAAITASTAGIVGWAVNKGLKKVNVGVNIPFVSLSYTVNIP